MKSKSIKLSLIEFLGTFYEKRLPKTKTLAIVKDIMQECEIAENGDSINKEEIVFRNKGNIYKIYCNSPKDKRSSNFINSVDDDSPRRQSETDKIREIIFNKIIADGFSLIGSITYYLKKNLESIEDDKGDLNNATDKFIKTFCEDVVSDSERNREFINYITVLDNYEKCAWVFVFLCFPKEVSSKNTDFRNELIDKLIQAQELSLEMKVIDITCNSNRIDKINASDIGRKDKISEIKKAVLNNKTVVVQGIGGIGKSYICKKIFWDYHDNYADDIKYLAWIQYNDDLNQSLISAFSFDNHYNIDSELSVFYSKIKEKETIEEKACVIKSYFDDLGKKLLVIVDNADYITREEKNWLNQCKCRMIITSRQKIDRLFTIPIKTLSKDYCLDLYIKTSESYYTEHDKDKIKEILERANYHTQTIELIAKAQYSLGYTPDRMYNALIESGFVLRNTSGLIESDDIELTMAKHLAKIFNLLNIHDDEQLKTIKLFSLLAPNERIEKQKVKEWFSLEKSDPINKLIKYGWLTGEGSSYVYIHPVISDVIRYMDCPDFEFASNLVDSLMIAMKSADDYIKRKEIIDHCISVAKKLECENDKYASLIYQIATVYLELCEYNKALEFFDKALIIREKFLGIEHPDTVSNYISIANAYTNRPDYDNALRYYNKALIIREKVLGDNHPDTASIYNKIALMYRDKGEYNKALEFFYKAKDIREKVLGLEHPDTASIYNNIALVHDDKGEYDKALEYYNKALAIREKVLGTEHPDIGRIYHNVAVVYHNQKKYNKSLDYYFKALKIVEKILGTEHLDTATIYNNIAEVYRKKYEYAMALKYHSKVLKIREKVLGDNHPDTASNYSNLGNVYADIGEYDKALEYYNKAKDIRENLLGTKIESTYNKIARVYQKMEEYDKALEYFSKVKEIREKVLGIKHLDTAKIYNDIALVYIAKEEYDKALEYFSKVKEIREKVLGIKHLDTAITYVCISFIYGEKDEYDKALEYANKALETIERTNHPNKAELYNDIALLYQKKREYEKALEYYKITYDICFNKYGSNHESTIETLNNIKEIEKILKENTEQDATITSYSKSEIIEKLRKNGLSEEQIKQILKS